MKKVLVIEDNEVNQDILQRRLAKKGYEVTIVDDGKKGLEAIEQMAPDIVLLDMSLPTMDGWQVAEKSKSNPSTKSIPIIALTAHAMAGDREKAIEAGCDEYETKPLQFEQLLEKIEKLTN